jgi:acyl-coenzyme A thioesterase PaaI-like protein
MTASVLGGDDDADASARVAAAQAVGRLAHEVVGRRLGPEHLDRVRTAADELSAAAQRLPLRSRLDEMAAAAAVARLKSGRVGRVLEAGQVADLFADSPVSGSANPLSVGLRISHEEPEAVGRVVIDSAFEGAPGRVHGGVVAACFDETMGGLLPILDVVAFTRTLTIAYHAPCPLQVELEFRARLHRRTGRKLHIHATGSAAGSVFAEGDALFISIDPTAFAAE